MPKEATHKSDDRFRRCRRKHPSCRYIALFLLLTTVCGSLAASGRTYYISVDGNDITGNGSKAGPWRTLNRACGRVRTAGDTIHILPGTYVENKTCLLAPGVSLKGSRTDDCIITSKLITNQFSAIIDAVSKEGTDGNQSVSNLTFDGNGETIAQAFNIRGRSNFSISHCIFRNFKYLAVYLSGREDAADAPPSLWATGNSFHDNIVTNCAAFADGYARGAVMAGGQQELTVYNNYITQLGRTEGTNGWPFKVWANDGYIKDSKIFNNIFCKEDASQWDFAIEMHHVRGVEIYDNHITGCVDAVDQRRGRDGYSIYVHDNIIGHDAPKQHDTYGIVLEGYSENAVIRRNFVRNISICMQFTTNFGTPIYDFEASYNVFSNIDCRGKTAYGGIRVLEDGSELSDFKVFNNIFHVNPGNRAFSGIEIRKGWKVSTKNISIVNNVFVNFEYWFVSPLGSMLAGLRLENNILYNNGNDNRVLMPGNRPANLIDRNRIADPKFISATNFHPHKSSPLIKKGIKIGLPSTDIEGLPVGNPPNIGAYETSGSNFMPAFDNASIANDRPDIMIVKFTSGLSESTPDPSSFRMKINTRTVDISKADIENGHLVLAFNAEIKPADLVSLSYMNHNGPQLFSVAGTEAAYFTNYPVRTNAHEQKAVCN